MDQMISIVVPVYNVGQYVAQCVESLTRQTYGNIEIILIDDGSTDNSGDICDSFKNDCRVRVFHTENKGLSAARNRGIDSARGEWIGFVDSDDRVEPGMFGTMLECAEKTDAQIVVCDFDREYVSGTRPSGMPEKRTELNGPDQIASSFTELLGVYAWNKLFRSSFFKDGFRFPEGRLFEDYYLSSEIIKNGGKVVKIPDRLYHYRQRASSIVHKHTPDVEADRWKARLNRYKTFVSVGADTRAVIKECVSSAFYVTCTFTSRKKMTQEEKDVRLSVGGFIREHYKEIIYGKYDFRTALKASVCRLGEAGVLTAKLIYFFISRVKPRIVQNANDLFT